MPQPSRPPVPRFLRFACAIALTSVVGVSASGCYASHSVLSTTDGGPRADARPAPDARPITDSGRDAPITRADAPLTCADCTCDFGGFDAGPIRTCESLSLWECCAVIGPLAPPDLPA